MGEAVTDTGWIKSPKPGEFEVPWHPFSKSRDEAERIAAETGGRVLEGDYHFFVIDPSKQDFFRSQRDKRGLVYAVTVGLPGDPTLMKKDRRLKKAMKATISDFVTNDPGLLKRHIERQTGLSLGPRLVETGSSGVSGKQPDDSEVQLYLLSQRRLGRNTPLARAEIRVIPRFVFEERKKQGRLPPNLNVRLISR